jgi:hypothetical protein
MIPAVLAVKAVLALCVEALSAASALLALLSPNLCKPSHRLNPIENQQLSVICALSRRAMARALPVACFLPADVLRALGFSPCFCSTPMA